jgi:hypothetical protein
MRRLAESFATDSNVNKAIESVELVALRRGSVIVNVILGKATMVESLDPYEHRPPYYPENTGVGIQADKENVKWRVDLRHTPQ